MKLSPDSDRNGKFVFFFTVTLSGSGGEQFRGFLVQARTMADGSPVGVFTDNGPDQKLSSCATPEVSRTVLVLLSIIHCQTAIVSARSFPI